MLLFSPIVCAAFMEYCTCFSNRFSRVQGFYHVERDAEADYLLIETNSASALEITENHMVFADNIAVPARQVQLGNKLGDSVVTAIKVVKR